MNILQVKKYYIFIFSPLWKALQKNNYQGERQVKATEEHTEQLANTNASVVKKTWRVFKGKINI